MGEPVDPAGVLAALAEVDNFVMVPRAVLRYLSPRDAIVLCYLRYRARGDWLDTNHAELGDGIGLSSDQVHRAMGALIEAGLVEWEEPDTFRRRRRYRIAASTPRSRGEPAADSRRPGTAESRRLPIEEVKSNEEVRTAPPIGAADAAALKEWYEVQEPRRTQPFLAIRQVYQSALRNGWDRDALLAAMTEVPVISGGALDMWRRRTTGTPRPRHDDAARRGAEDRTGTTGKWEM